MREVFILPDLRGKEDEGVDDDYSLADIHDVDDINIAIRMMNTRIIKKDFLLWKLLRE